MGRTFIRQSAQIRNSVTYDDTVAAGSTLESNPTNIEDDLNAARSQLKRVLWADSAGNWYDDIPTHNAKKRGIDQLAEHLDELEEQPFLFRTQKLEEITVPANVKATGTLTLTGNAANGETVTIDTKTYTFQTVLTDVDGNVLIGATASDSIDNLIAAITLGSGAGTTYAASTTLHPTVTATAGVGDTMDAEAKLGGTQGNLIATTTTLGSGSWGGSTLSGGTGDIVVLSVASTEAPSETAAVGSVATEGAVVAYNASFPNAALDEVAGQGPIRPNNLCLVVDADKGTPIESIISSDPDVTRDIYALIQSEIVTDGHTFDDATQRVELTFVRVNAEGTDLELCPSADIAGKIINYAYVRQMHLDNIPKWAFLTGAFLDESAAASVTLNQAIDNQVGIATQVQDIDWNIADNYDLAFTTDSGGTDLLIMQAAAAGDTIQINTDDLDINSTNDVDISNAIKVDTSGTEIDIGVTAGTIETTSSDDLELQAGGELLFDDGNRTGSTWSAPIKLADTTAEWDAFETEFGGEVSLLRAIVLASKQENRTKGTAVVTSGIPADTNATGAGGSPNLDAQLPDYSYVGSFVSDVDVFLNGELLRGGADASANNDVYPGDTPANGDLKFEFALVASPGNPDTITMIVYGESTT